MKCVYASLQQHLRGSSFLIRVKSALGTGVYYTTCAYERPSLYRCLGCFKSASKSRPYAYMAYYYDHNCIIYVDCAYRCFELSSWKQDIHVLDTLTAEQATGKNCSFTSKPFSFYLLFVHSWLVEFTTAGDVP